MDSNGTSIVDLKPRPRRRRVYVCSPLRGTPQPTAIGQRLQEEGNKRLAQELCRLAAAAGVAPYAPHLLFPQFLDDAKPEEREAGIHCGLAFLETCEEVWVYTGRGMSSGMRQEAFAAGAAGIPIEFDPACWRNLDLFGILNNGAEEPGKERA